MCKLATTFTCDCISTVGMRLELLLDDLLNVQHKLGHREEVSYVKICTVHVS